MKVLKKVDQVVAASRQTRPVLRLTKNSIQRKSFSRFFIQHMSRFPFLRCVIPKQRCLSYCGTLTRFTMFY